MPNPGGGALPDHVSNYLKNHKVPDPTKLPADVLAVYASLGPDEIKILEKTGAVLDQSLLDVKIIASIH